MLTCPAAVGDAAWNCPGVLGSAGRGSRVVPAGRWLWLWLAAAMPSARRAASLLGRERPAAAPGTRHPGGAAAARAVLSGKCSPATHLTSPNSFLRLKFSYFLPFREDCENVWKHLCLRLNGLKIPLVSMAFSWHRARLPNSVRYAGLLHY